MKFEDVVAKIKGKSSLNRLLNVAGLSAKTLDEGVLKQTLIKSKKVFLDEKRILKKLSISEKNSQEFDSNYFFKRIFLSILLFKQKDYLIEADEKTIINEIKNFIKEIKTAKNYYSSNNKDELVMETIISVVLEDESISFDEARIIEKIRRKLGISPFKFLFLLEKSGVLNFFEKVIGKKDVQFLRKQLNELEFNGLIYNIQEGDNAFYVIPEEITTMMRLNGQIQQILGLDIGLKNYGALLDYNQRLIQNSDKIRILKKQGVSDKGSNDDLNKKIIYNQILAKYFLNELSNTTLKAILEKENLKISGSKEERIQRIIERFECMDREIVSEVKDSRETLFTYYNDLAERNSEKLIKKRVCMSEKEIGKRFEYATEYLFKEKLNCTLKDVKLPNHERNVNADGCVTQDNDYYLLWDCKTKNNLFSFTNDEEKQFTQYINGYKKKLKNKQFSFLIITPKITDENKVLRYLTKIKIDTGIDITLILARDLEKFAKFIESKKAKFNLRIFSGKPILNIDYLKSLTYK
ncbi:MAG: SAP domain-containing protein [Candidatus Nanoarchaeia archaeon]